MWTDVDGDGLRRLLAERPELQLLDVRTPGEYVGLGHVPGATLRPVQLIHEWADTLDAAKPVALLCQHGVRSVHACQWLAQQGFRELYNLAGGMSVYEGDLAYDPSPDFPISALG